MGKQAKTRDKYLKIIIKSMGNEAAVNKASGETLPRCHVVPNFQSTYPPAPHMTCLFSSLPFPNISTKDVTNVIK